MIREAIVLAGGLGTRLKSVVPDLPKCLAPVAGRPFLEYLLACYRKQGIRRFIF
ncbi:MAG TPA: NTP transferase domain-containing protein, partial [Puia sp.]